MLRTRQIQDCVIDGDKEVRRRPAESTGERRFAQKLNRVIADQPPKLAGGNPDASATTHDFRRAFTGAGHSSPPSLALNGNLPRQKTD